MLDFLNNLSLTSVLFGIAIAYFSNLFFSLEQYLLELWAIAYQKKKVLIKLNKDKSCQ